MRARLLDEHRILTTAGPGRAGAAGDARPAAAGQPARRLHRGARSTGWAGRWRHCAEPADHGESDRAPRPPVVKRFTVIAVRRKAFGVVGPTAYEGGAQTRTAVVSAATAPAPTRGRLHDRSGPGGGGMSAQYTALRTPAPTPTTDDPLLDRRAIRVEAARAHIAGTALTASAGGASASSSSTTWSTWPGPRRGPPGPRCSALVAGAAAHAVRQRGDPRAGRAGRAVHPARRGRRRRRRRRCAPTSRCCAPRLRRARLRRRAARRRPGPAGASASTRRRATSRWRQHFAALGCAAPGTAMMCATAALQVNLDAGPAARWAQRLGRIRALGPVLVALSACSPYLAGETSGWRSMRQQAWHGIDHARSDPVVRRRPGRRVGGVRAARAGDAGARPGRPGARRARAHAGRLRRLAGRRRADRPAAHARRPRLPPDDAVPAGAPARLRRDPLHRRAARPLVAGRRRRDRHAGRRPGRRRHRGGAVRAGGRRPGRGGPRRAGRPGAARGRAGLRRGRAGAVSGRACARRWRATRSCSSSGRTPGDELRAAVQARRPARRAARRKPVREQTRPRPRARRGRAPTR